MYFSKNSGVIDYLINRTNERIKTMQKSRLVFINTISIEELKQNKSLMIKQFLEIEDDLKQSILALSSLLAQNRDMVEEKENNSAILRKSELRAFSLEKTINEITIKYEKLKEENEICNKKLIENNKLLDKFHERISNYETVLEEKQEYIIYLEKEINNIRQHFDEKEKALRNLQTTSIKPKQENERSNENTLDRNFSQKSNQFLTESNVLNHTFHKEEENNNEFKNEVNDDDHYNVNNYLSERQNKKKIINDMIKEHLQINKEDTNLNPIPEHDNTEEENLTDEEERGKLRDNLIIKINNLDGCLEYLEEVIGIDFLSKLLMQNVSSSYLAQVERSLNDYISSKQVKSQDLSGNKNLRYEMGVNKRNKNEDNNEKSLQNSKNLKESNSIKDSSNPLNSSNNIRNKSLSNQKSSSKNMYTLSDSSAQGFETSLRNYKNPSMIRVFKNYSRSKGNYFDPLYQYGGESVLSKNNNSVHSRSKTVSVNETKESFLKLTQQSNKNKV